MLKGHCRRRAGLRLRTAQGECTVGGVRTSCHVLSQTGVSSAALQPVPGLVTTFPRAFLHQHHEELHASCLHKCRSVPRGPLYLSRPFARSLYTLASSQLNEIPPCATQLRILQLLQLHTSSDPGRSVNFSAFRWLQLHLSQQPLERGRFWGVGLSNWQSLGHLPK